MLAKIIVPFKFLTAVVEIIISLIIVQTSSVYGTANNTSDASFAAGCILITAFSIIQIIFTMTGVNIFDARIHFENTLCNLIGGVLLIWFVLATWNREYIWYIWGFLCIYPIINELLGLLTIMCHSQKIVFEKYRAEN